MVGLSSRGEDLVDGGGRGALGRVTGSEAQRGDGGRELNATKGDSRIDLRHGIGNAAKPVREDVRH